MKRIILYTVLFISFLLLLGLYPKTVLISIVIGFFALVIFAIIKGQLYTDQITYARGQATSRGSSHTINSAEPPTKPMSETEQVTHNIKNHEPSPFLKDKVKKLKYNGSNLQECLDYIKDRIQLIKQIDRDFYVFGSGGWKYEFRKVEEEELNKLEQESGKKLPEEFRAFLLQIGHGAGPSYGAYPEAPLIVENLNYFCLTEGEEDKPFEDGYISLSEHGCGIETRISLHENYYGEIWRFDSGNIKVADNYIDWYIMWINELLYIFADGRAVSLNTCSI